MKKITILVDQLYQHGGIEKLVAIKANYWVTHYNYNVTIVSTEQNNNPLIYELDPKVQFLDLGINYHRLKSFFSFKNLTLAFLNIVKIQQYLSRNKPDYVLVASHIPMTYVLPFLIRGKTRIVKEFHFTKYYSHQNNNLKQRVFNYIEAKYDTLVVLSPEEQSFYKTTNTVVIPNPVITAKGVVIIPQEKKELIAATALRFAPVKRLELLIDIWEQFSKTHPTWKLLIYGPLDNEYAAKIQQLAVAKNLSAQIIFEGKTTHVLQELSKARVVLITSAQECFPLFLLEAHSVGVPVISFNCPTGPRNIIHNKKDGLLVENNNIPEFVSTLQKFSNNAGLQEELALNALENANLYQLDRVMKQWKNKIFNT